MTVQVFVSSRLDYCNRLMYGITDGLMQRVQAVQNAAAQLITGTHRRDHITPVLWQLHWHPIRGRAYFQGTAWLWYLVDHCQLITAASRHQQQISES